uniref:Uncharacterized protein n=1 Tax=viral metagenome TaxID=1070528 RepID=A0A6C0B613_9ZZZZ
MFINILLFLTSLSSLWNISLNTGGAYSLSFKNNIIITNNCPHLILSDYGTTVSPCDPKLYSPPRQTVSANNSYRNFNNVTKTIISYYPTSNILLPIIDAVFISPNTLDSTLIMYLNLSKTTRTNWISPLYGGTWNFGFDKTRILRVPHDNDLQSMYLSIDADSILAKGTSSYVSSFYDDSSSSNKGLTIGFLEHQIWKTGIEYSKNQINAIAGINGILITRDREPHGVVNVTQTPLLYISMDDDWRTGLEDYSKTVEQILPFKINKSLGVFTGWNSWGLAVSKTGTPTVKILEGVTNAFNNITSLSNNSTYITRDAVYFLNNNQTTEWVSYVHSKDMKAGTYSSPFVLWAPIVDLLYIGCDSNLCNKTSPQCYPIFDVVLKDKNNLPIKIVEPNNKIRHILDVTHPITKCMLEYQISNIKQQKMDLVKYDFLNLAAYEGQRHNMQLAPTGFSAYYYALNMLYELWNNSIVLDFGITPPFPIVKGMSTRRHGCDQMFGGVEYTMNQYAGGWWLKNFYLLDPDLISLQEDYWFTPEGSKITKIFSADSKSRISKGVVYGGEFKNGDDLTNKSNLVLFNKYFGNSKINKMWGRSKTGLFNTSFRPISWEAEKAIIPLLPNIIPPSTFIRDNGDIVIFNFGLFEKKYTIDLHETMLSNIRTVTCEDLWENKSTVVTNFKLAYSVKSKSSAVLECRNNH